ncbi:MAG: hypothetical protein M1438_00395 [Deltaproteobacteria bacterium]|nr:hypothetical protein [Deltaproteobacteria bacterium]
MGVYPDIASTEILALTVSRQSSGKSLKINMLFNGIDSALSVCDGFATGLNLAAVFKWLARWCGKR